MRSIAGYLIEVGLGRFDPNDTKVLDRKKRKADVKTAQPQGLFLWNVFIKNGRTTGAEPWTHWLKAVALPTELSSHF